MTADNENQGRPNFFNRIRNCVLYEYAKILVVGFFLAMALRSSIVEANWIPSESMRPTLDAGDYLFVNKLAYQVRIPFVGSRLFSTFKVKRGDIVTFPAPDDPEITYIKRAIGLPGDKIQVINGRLHLNGEPVPNKLLPESAEDAGQFKIYNETLSNRSFTIRRLPDNRPHGDTTSITVPPDSLFVMGDNRDRSRDSRYFGFVPIESVKGKAVFRLFSLDTSKWRFRLDRFATLLGYK